MFNRIRAWWRNVFQTSTVIVPPTVVEQARARGISERALYEADRHGARVFLPEMVYQRPEAMPGVVPAGMALDSTLPSMDAIAAVAMAQYQHEGLGFLGYPYLAQLSQRAEYRHVCGIWAEHCTRKWIKVTGDDAKVEKINQELARLDVQNLYREAIEKERIFGRMQLFMDFGDFDKPEELRVPLIVKPEKINAKRALQRVALVEPMWSYPGIYNAQNPLAPDFYNPSEWYVSGRTVHASRMATLVGNPMPNMLKPAYAFGGVSLAAMCKPYVDNWLRTRQSVSDLVHSFSVMVLATEMDQRLADAPSGATLFERIDFFNKTRDNRGTFVIDKETETFANVSAPIAGLDKLQAQALEQIASVSGIPLVILLGVTPSGLNASSDGEIRAFYDKVIAYNEKVLRPGLHTLLDVVQLSLFGEIDQTIGFEFESLWEMSDADKAAIRKSDAEADATYVNAGVVDPEETRNRLNNEEGGLYRGLLTGPAPDMPDDGGDGAENDGGLGPEE